MPSGLQTLTHTWHQIHVLAPCFWAYHCLRCWCFTGRGWSGEAILLPHLSAPSVCLQNCVFVKDFYDIYPHGPTLTFGIIRDTFKGDYTCIVTFRENGRAYNLTRTVRMKVVGKEGKLRQEMGKDPGTN